MLGVATTLELNAGIATTASTWFSLLFFFNLIYFK
jgi:hypothetical protein